MYVQILNRATKKASKSKSYGELALVLLDLPNTNRTIELVLLKQRSVNLINKKGQHRYRFHYSSNNVAMWSLTNCFSMGYNAKRFSLMTVQRFELLTTARVNLRTGLRVGR